MRKEAEGSSSVTVLRLLLPRFLPAHHVECLFLLTGPGHDQLQKILNLATGTNSWNPGATMDTEGGEKVTSCFYLFVPHSTHLKGEGSTRSGLRF